MLGKLLIYEFKNTYKIMLVVYALLAGITLFGMLVYSFNTLSVLPPDLEDMIQGTTLLLYSLSAFAMIVLTFVYLCIHFYKTMYSDQGYLTHTLPVTPMATFNVKLFTAFFWMLVSMLLLFLSILLLAGSVSHWELITQLRFKDLLELRDFIRMFGFRTLGGFILYLLFTLMLSCLSRILLVFTSISIGQLFNQHKIAAAVAVGIGLYFAEQIASNILALILGYNFLSALGDSFSASETEMLAIWQPVFIGAALFSLAFVVLFYVICAVIVRKHINLD